MGRRRAEVRPRYGRVAILTAAVTVTAIAVLGGFGLLPPGPEDASAEPDAYVPSAAERPSQALTPADQAERRRDLEVVPATKVRRSTTTTATLPTHSGSGRRIVFSESEQRVWLVDGSGRVTRSYLVSGSATDNLHPGTYAVFSKSRHAVGIDDSGTMEYFVRFTHGDGGGAIGFHTIPVDDGAAVQTTAQLGTPLSHGCVRQRTADAIALWAFAPIGTTVVVTD